MAEWITENRCLPDPNYNNATLLSALYALNPGAKRIYSPEELLGIKKKKRGLTDKQIGAALSAFAKPKTKPKEKNV